MFEDNDNDNNDDLFIYDCGLAAASVQILNISLPYATQGHVCSLQGD